MVTYDAVEKNDFEVVGGLCECGVELLEAPACPDDFAQREKGVFCTETLERAKIGACSNSQIRVGLDEPFELVDAHINEVLVLEGVVEGLPRGQKGRMRGVR